MAIIPGCEDDDVEGTADTTLILFCGFCPSSYSTRHPRRSYVYTWTKLQGRKKKKSNLIST